MLLLFVCSGTQGFSWGFYGHKLINFRAVFLLPPEMVVFYKKHIEFLKEHAVDPDKRRYAIEQEGPRHYIDLDKYDVKALPKSWSKAVKKYSEDSLAAHGIVPWWIQVMLKRLTTAFKDNDAMMILKMSAELGHYVGDAHVPLHTSSNHNGQLTDQYGIHGFWESRIPEMYAENGWDLIAERAHYLKNPLDYAWQTVYDSFAASDSVLTFERMLNSRFSGDKKYAYENRNGLLIKQYSTQYAWEYNYMLDGMIERRLRQAISGVASLWYTAWANAGKPDLKNLTGMQLDEHDKQQFEQLNNQWRSGQIKGRSC